MTDDLFSEETPTPPEHLITPEEQVAENFFDKLVGEGKKFTDPEALAKAKIESDNFIKRIQDENAGLRQDLANRLKLEEFMEKMKEVKPEAPQPSASNPGTPSPGERDEPKPETKQVSIDDVYKEIEARFEKKQTAAQMEANVQEVHRKAQETYGPQYKVELTKRAKALDIDTDSLQKMAATQPKAFLKLMVDDAAPQPDFTPPPETDFTPSGGPSEAGGLSTQKDFQKVRQENPKLYWSPQFQNKMHEIAIKKGEAFFDG